MEVTSYTSKVKYKDFIRQAYRKNRDAINSDYRSSQSKNVLVTADSDAVRTMAEKLRALKYDSEHGTEVLNTTKAFVQSYNNLIESSDGTQDSTIQSLQKKMSKMTREEKEELESIGITIKSNGKLSLDEKTFGKSRPEKIGRILSSEGTFSSAIRTVARKLYRTAEKMPVYDAKAQTTSLNSSTSGGLVDASL